MTTYPHRQDHQFAASHADMKKRLRVAEQQVNVLKSQNSQLAATVESLLTRIGDPNNTGTAGVTKAQFTALAALTSAQLTFLTGLNGVTRVDNYPLIDDPGSGSTWQAGERNYVNSSIDMCNNLVQKFIASGLMHA